MLDRKLVDELGVKLAKAYQNQKGTIRNQNIELVYYEREIADRVWNSWLGIKPDPSDKKERIENILPEEIQQEIGLDEDERIRNLSESKQKDLYSECLNRMLQILKKQKF